MDSKTESKLLSLTSQIMSPAKQIRFDLDWVGEKRMNSFITKVMSLVSSMDLDLQPKPESEFMSLTTQIFSLLHSMDSDSMPKPLSNLISLLSQGNFDHNTDFRLFFRQTMALEPEPIFMSLIYQIFSLVISMNTKRDKLISLCPQACVVLGNNGNFEVIVKKQEGQAHKGKAIPWSRDSKWECLPFNWKTYWSSGDDVTHFRCRNCDGDNHKEYEKAPVEIKHSLHRKHSLQLVLLDESSYTRVCYCCDEDLKRMFYYCRTCDFGLNFVCAKKEAILYIDQPKWHEHTLALFLRKTSLTCNACGLSHSSCPLYMCPPCDFVIHKSCISLPRLIRISRHFHRIAYTPSFDEGDWSCSVCRKKIDNDYGGYVCTKGCSYAAHSKCATQSNVWDGIELEGEPEDIEEEVLPPFLEISDGIIQHFSHQQHHMKLDENTGRDYDENKECEACIRPIYFGNFYSCLECDFILHEECANLSRKIHHPIHPHLLNLIGGFDGVINYYNDKCSACIGLCKGGFFYECGKQGCKFMLHVQCATTSEPLVHESHRHPLFLTSKPGEKIRCSVCKDSEETFNCIECDFALCFYCAILPQKVRYKHDKHTLTLSYGKETGTSWCEVCEAKINLKGRFYMCNEYCCVTLHIKCTLGDLHMRPGSTWITFGNKVDVLHNSNRMSRSICSYCVKHCPYKIVYMCSGLILCSQGCVVRSILQKRGRYRELEFLSRYA
ncbi:Cysteine/Histidine-rich C1 domain family protein [Arabidopsis thaliana]|jgi:hypothetical protein|uniref:Cysteine/Histidine-rich C1 domain family protein n=2 Tax=Arabidopsis thaliana TaxID=3702 RepID=F4IIQ1_ARATH|nr:Cysteine/Histidine-rich C1 domain family protein [Arabidopsis thaliana]AEC08126.1 Cysteine/Histidine-rich C1 domain family protein [Arabidopsis thaliana]|eukprot:NP_180413.2 Cysteine/Histidine-rich C1 domain family protein [Arabidopsis thaliana]